MSWSQVFRAPECQLTAPAIARDGSLLAASSNSGQIFRWNPSTSELSEVVNTASSPTALCDTNEGLYIGDNALAAITRLGPDASLEPFVSEYEAKPLKGPSALTVDAAGSMCRPARLQRHAPLRAEISARRPSGTSATRVPSARPRSPHRAALCT